MAESVKASDDPPVAADVIAEEAYQRFKVTTGADGTATDVSSADPMPVADAALGAASDGEATGNGSVIAVLKRLRALLGGGLPSSLTGSGNLKVTLQEQSLSSPVPVRISDGSEGIGTTAKRLHVDDGGSSLTVDSPALGTEGEAEATGNGGIIGVLKRLRKLLEGSGVIKVSELEKALPAGTNAIGQTDPRGNKAHDEVDAGNPIKTGGRARTALAAAVSQDDRSDMTTDKHGRQLVTEYPRDQKSEGRLNLTNNTEQEVLAAAGASTRWVVTGIIVSNASATVETKVEIKDDTTAKVIVHAGTRGGGAAPPCPPGGFFIGTENKAIKVKAVTTGADVEVFVCGYKIPA